MEDPHTNQKSLYEITNWEWSLTNPMEIGDTLLSNDRRSVGTWLNKMFGIGPTM